ncbi:hypothetical protein D3C72_1987470 [compost metagenome]
MLLVLTSTFVIYRLAAIGWQFAVPVEKLAAIIEDGNGGPIADVANIYLPPSMAWIAFFRRDYFGLRRTAPSPLPLIWMQTAFCSNRSDGGAS